MINKSKLLTRSRGKSDLLKKDQSFWGCSFFYTNIWVPMMYDYRNTNINGYNLCLQESYSIRVHKEGNKGVN